jgi:hypothetical protein
MIFHSPFQPQWPVLGCFGSLPAISPEQWWHRRLGQPNHAIFRKLVVGKITKPCYIQKPLGTGGDFWKLLQLYTITILQLWNLPNPARVIVFSLQTCFLWLGFRVTRIFWKKPLLHRKHDYKTTNKMYQNVSTWILALHCGWTVSIFTSRKDKSYQLLGLINTFTHLYGGCYHGYTEYVNYIGYGHP